MTIIIIDDVALGEILLPVVKVIGVAMWIFVTLQLTSMTIDSIQDSRKRKQNEKNKIIAKKIYNKREIEFVNNPELWNNWQKKNYKICNLVEHGHEETYY